MKKARILSVIFAAVMATFGIFAVGCGKEEKRTETTSKDEQIVINGKEEKAIPMPSALAFRGATMLSEEGEPVAQSASVTLTATITPSSATNQKVDWSVAFSNPTSTWASGKTVTDYVTVTPTSDGALTASVECLQAFGEQIKITVTSRDNASAKATCTCDYYKRVTDVSVAMTQNGSAASSMKFSSDVSGLTDDGPTTEWTVTPTYGVGTITEETTFSLTLDHAQALTTYMYSHWEMQSGSGAGFQSFRGDEGNGEGVTYLHAGIAPLAVSYKCSTTWQVTESGLTLSVVANTDLLRKIFFGDEGTSALHRTKAVEYYNEYLSTGNSFLELYVAWSGTSGVSGDKTFGVQGAAFGVESITVDEETVTF